jgi:hypothetical protein
MQFGGGQGNIVRKIRTRNLPPEPTNVDVLLRTGLLRRVAANHTRSLYGKPRAEIEKESKERQERWRQKAGVRPQRGKQHPVPSTENEPPRPPTRS